jgi:hypothetical protein
MYTFRMYLRGRYGIAIPVILLLVLSALLSMHASTAEAQNSGRRAATQEDIAWLTWSGIPNPTVGMTIDPNNPYSGQAASEAKMWLAQRTKIDRSRIVCLNPLFAQKLKRLMENVPGGAPQITAAYRTIPEQEKAMQSGASRVKNACSGYHLYGLAADFNNNSKEQTSWMRAHAREYGIATIGNWDPNHFQDAEGRSGQCGVCPAAGTGDASSSGSGYTSSGSPSAGLTSSLRQWLTPQPQTQATPSQPAMPSQPVSTSQNPLDAFNPPSITPQLTPTSTNATSTNAAADRLEELAFGGQPTTTNSTATSVPLVVSGSDAAMLTSTQQASTTSVTPSQGAISPSQTTFTSGDLAWQDETVSSNPVSGVQAIIITIRAALNRITQHLVPFGGVAEDGE